MYRRQVVQYPLGQSRSWLPLTGAVRTVSCETRHVAEVIHIEDAADPRLDDFRDLSKADRRPDRPGGRGLVIAEGVAVVRRLLASPYPVRALLGVRGKLDELAADLRDRDVPAYVSSAEVMADAVGFHLNRGVLAVADRRTPLSAQRVAATAETLMVLEGVGDHENLGVLFRNAAALGVSGPIGVLLGRGCADPLYRRSVRVSMGNVLRVPFASMESWPEGLELLRTQGYRILALTPAADAVPIAELDGVDRERPALLLGTEGSGLSAAALGHADRAVRIPMAPGVDSLNVATSAALASYELRARG